MSLNIKLITPEKVVFNNIADETIVPSITGQLGILPDHAPMVAALDIGVLRIKYESKWLVVILFGGFVEVRNNQVTIVANDIEDTSKIKGEEVNKQLSEAFIALDLAETAKEKIRASEELKKASARVQAFMYLTSN